MNIEERNRYIQSINQWDYILQNTKLIGEPEKAEKKKEKFLENLSWKQFDWSKLYRPPISSYIPPDVVYRLEEISNTVRLMNKPTERFKLQNDLLRPYGFHPLNSGTNRRAFYHERDIGVVLKLGSDKVGKSDNIAEFNLQKIIAPFCTKVFDVTPTGVCQLAERVETMTEEDYKEKYTDLIFDLIMAIYYKGYIMEDVGANFFKNWGVRVGFGPVILDFPYIYEVDYSKLKCTRRDPFTNVVCGGDIDYDYAGGMSQIICEKCGARYTAKYLAKKIPSTAFTPIIEGKKEYSMSLINTNLKVFVTKKNVKTGEKQVIHRYYNESDTRQEVPVRSNKPYVERTVTNTEYQPRRDNRNNNYPQAVRNDLNDFLCNIDKKYGKRIAVDMAKKLGFRYEYRREERQQVLHEEKKEQGGEDNSSPLTFKDKADKYKNIHENKVILGEVEEKPSNNLEQPKIDKPIEGLFPMKPKSAEEIEKEELEERQETAVMGFLGESGVDKIRRMEMIPKIKSMVIARFNGFEGNSNDDTLGDRLASKIMDFIYDDMKKLLGTTDGVEVKCTKTNDNLNNICYKTYVTNYGSAMFDCELYPQSEIDNMNKGSNQSITNIKKLLVPEVEKTEDTDKKISDALPMTENELRVFFEDEAISFNFDTYPKRNKELQHDLEAYLLNKLLDKVNTVPFPLAQRKVNEYVEMYYPIDTEDISSEL